jgi:hypothetical protein
LEAGLQTADVLKQRREEQALSERVRGIDQTLSPAEQAQQVPRITGRPEDVLAAAKIGVSAEPVPVRDKVAETKQIEQIKSEHKTKLQEARFEHEKDLAKARTSAEKEKAKSTLEFKKKKLDEELKFKREKLEKGEVLTEEEQILQSQKIRSGAFSQAKKEADLEFPDIVPRTITLGGFPMANPDFDPVIHETQYAEYENFIRTRAAELSGEEAPQQQKQRETAGELLERPRPKVVTKTKPGAPVFNQEYVAALQAANPGTSMDEIIADYNEQFGAE